VISIAPFCRICDLEKDVRYAIDEDIANGLPGTVIGKKYKKQIARGKPQDYICKHRRLGHHLERVSPPADAGTMTAIKEERHRKTVDERIDELYNLSLAGSKIAIKKPEPDIRDWRLA